jgi:PKD repeat protein
VDVNDPATGGQNWSARALFIGPNVPVNSPPVSRTAFSCPTLTCNFDGRASSDTDGTIVSQQWNFGDATTGSGATTSHTYAAPGTYSVVHTVTDDKGAANSTSDSIVVSDPSSSPIAFVGATGAASTTKTPTVTLPGTLHAGDVILLSLNLNSSVAVSTAPSQSGWTALGTANASGLQSFVWWKVAAAGDAGTTVSTPLASGVKATLQSAVYTGTNKTTPVDVFASRTDLTTGASHTTPTVTASPGDWVVSMWADKSSSGQEPWTTPAGVSARTATYGTGTGSGFVGSVVGDGGAAVGTEVVGGLTAVTSQAGVRAATWTITLKP